MIVNYPNSFTSIMQRIASNSNIEAFKRTYLKSQKAYLYDLQKLLRASYNFDAFEACHRVNK